MRGEFELIERYFAPLAARTPGALALEDDAAILTPPSGEDLVFTVDTIVAGVHFLPDDPPEQVAKKLLRVNLSDLAAMGARPLGYLLSVALAKTVEEAWIASFAEGLAEDQMHFGLGVMGGDTTSTPGPATLTLTAVGAVPQGKALRRNAARRGDAVYVSGNIGDSALGLQYLKGILPALDGPDAAFLTERYRLPSPRLELGRALVKEGLAEAAIDISDGLMADLGHLCKRSGLAARIMAAAVPLSSAAQRLVEQESRHLGTALTGGDDYELLFTASPEQARALATLAARLDLPLTRIGEMVEGSGVTLLDAENVEIRLEYPGWTHF